MAPGVGKTYRMLEEGHRRAGRGTDVVVGLVETHGRSVVGALVEGLELIPRRRVDYRGVVVEEMDTVAILARKPTVALVDEIAHTNAPGSERAKRWEDVEAIRDAGIHVVSTLNVQHLDSVADAVATITGAPVHERVPDEVLLQADEIELVDMSPHALRQRMKHGNVYPPERAQVALDRFFTEGNLTALRELSLRLVARRVEGQLETTQDGQQLPLVTERVLVLVDGGPACARAVRRAAALAGALRAAFLAVVIDTPESQRSSFDRQRDLKEAVDDARTWGPTSCVSRPGTSLEGLEQVARSTAGDTRGAVPSGRCAGLQRLLGRPLADRLLERLPDIEVHLIGAPSRSGHV